MWNYYEGKDRLFSYFKYCLNKIYMLKLSAAIFNFTSDMQWFNLFLTDFPEKNNSPNPISLSPNENHNKF